jgi:hypothetical protein
MLIHIHVHNIYAEREVYLRRLEACMQNVRSDVRSGTRRKIFRSCDASVV